MSLSQRSATGLTARALALVGLLLSLCAFVAPAAQAAPTRPASLDNTWACSVPAGYTYDQVQNNLNVCSPSNFAYSYHLRTPQDNIWACSVPTSNLTYDRVQDNLNVCSPSNFAYSYHLRIPVNGLWACSVPPGFSYDLTQNNLNVCSPSNFAYSYRLRG